MIVHSFDRIGRFRRPSEENIMPWSLKDSPDMTGRTAVVTGANSGLGLETARALAGAGALVLMACRNAEKGQRAVEEVASASASAPQLVQMDLASLASVRAAADSILASHPSVDILVNNAGVMAISESKTEDGFETQFGVNHLGHYALTAQLLPALLRAQAARVVTVTSTAHHFGRSVSESNPHMHGKYVPWNAYFHSKLANFHFGIGLQRQFAASGAPASSLLAHPGLADTNLQTVSVEGSDGGAPQRFFLWLAHRTGTSPANGARPQIRAAVDPSAKGGEFYAPRFGNNGPPVRRPVLRRVGASKAISRLWRVSERETGIKLDVAAAMAHLTV